MIRGRVRWFDKEKGYGFIVYKDVEDIFIHYSNINMTGYKYVDEGDVVEFDLIETSKGYQARNIKLYKKNDIVLV